MFEATKIIVDVLLTIICLISLKLIFVTIKNYLKKNSLRKKGNIYIAIQLVLDEGTDVEKNNICRLELFDLDEEVQQIINKSGLVYSVEDMILKSKISSIRKYYFRAIKENLFTKAKLRHQAKN